MIKSFQKNQKGILLMVVSSLCVCFGQLLWKLSVSQGLLALVFGFILYGIGAVVMIWAYRFGKLSVLQPMLSLNYILSTVLAAIVLNEEITLTRCVGIVVIFCGVICIAGGDD